MDSGYRNYPMKRVLESQSSKEPNRKSKRSEWDIPDFGIYKK